MGTPLTVKNCIFPLKTASLCSTSSRPVRHAREPAQSQWGWGEAGGQQGRASAPRFLPGKARQSRCIESSRVKIHRVHCVKTNDDPLVPGWWRRQGREETKVTPQPSHERAQGHLFPVWKIWCASGRGGVHPRGPPTQGLEAKRGELGSSPCTGPFYNQGGFLSALQAVPTFYGHRGFWNLL